MEDPFRIILFTNYAFLIICTFLGILQCKKLDKNEKWYVYYTIFIFLIQALTEFFIQIFHYKDTSFLYPIYIVGEFFILTTLFIKKLKLSPYWFFFTSVLIIFFSVENVFSVNFDNDFAKVFSNIIIICLAGYALLQEIKINKIINRFLWVDAFIFFSYLLSIFTFILQEKLSTISKDSFFIIWGINNVLSTVLYISFIYTFLRLKK